MEGTIQINNCGVYTKVSKKQLCAELLKNSPRRYKSYARMFYTDVDFLISKLHEAIMIQVYETGVVRLFFEYGHFEERYAMYFKELPDIVLNILKSYNLSVEK